MMDFNWFTLSATGVMMVSWAGCLKDEAELRQRPVDIGGKTVDHEMKKTEIHLVPSNSKQTVAVKMENKPRCFFILRHSKLVYIVVRGFHLTFYQEARDIFNTKSQVTHNQLLTAIHMYSLAATQPK